jgi:hypothetical protein
MEPDISLKPFFAEYANRSMSPDPQRLADLYAETFIVGGPRGSQAFRNDGRFRDWLRQVGDFNRKHGMEALDAVAVEDITLSARHTLATVRWGARFAKTGDRRIEFEISYLLERTDDAWRILSYISRLDQDEEMTRLGLL